ncbi:response regulator [Corticibacter populi]|uniref:Virulence sensor protein BvgS n=2 Tax=Corticibacter populi TaxID=1550736 RepID=A0A3M6QRC9_9BURK|nr:response regulator [Corticibacter populi]RZS31121.1 signal transduction histidine kinase [Corticibacter populi]
MQSLTPRRPMPLPRISPLWRTDLGALLQRRVNTLLLVTLLPLTALLAALVLHLHQSTQSTLRHTQLRQACLQRIHEASHFARSIGDADPARDASAAAFAVVNNGTLLALLLQDQLELEPTISPPPVELERALVLTQDVLRQARKQPHGAPDASTTPDYATASRTLAMLLGQAARQISADIETDLQRQQSLTRSSVLGCAALMLLIFGLLWLAMQKVLRNHLHQPYQLLLQSLRDLSEKRYSEPSLLLQDLRPPLLQIQKLLMQGDQLLREAASEAESKRLSRQWLELSKTIPGVLFQFELQASGARACHFISPKAGAMFRPGATGGPTATSARAHWQQDDTLVPLALTRSLTEQALALAAAESTLEYDTAIEQSGQWRWIRTLASVSRQTEGVLLVNGVWLDVSDNIQQAEALRKARASAEQAAQEKAHLLAVMSHEIRTPLNGILGMTQVALKDPLIAVQRERLEKVQRAGRHLLDITNDILDFSKMESGRLELEQTRFSLSELVAEVADMLTPRAAEKNLEFWIDVDAGLADTFIGDPYRIRQILINFVANAIKFTPAGEVSIRVTQAGDAPGQAILRFEVCDTGIGIAPEEQGRLFQAFEQADVSITRRYGGTGLGLAISSQLAKLLGGSTGLRSTPGRGSVFWFTATVQTDPSAPPDGEDPVQRRCHSLHVLLAESHEGSRNAVARMLRESFGCKVTACASGAQALQQLAAQQVPDTAFELCLLSSQLADMTGLQLIEQAQQAGKLHCPVWLAVSHGETSPILGWQAAGVTHILSKPVGIAQIRAILRRLEPPDSAKMPLPSVPHRDPANAQPPLDTPARLLVVDDNQLNRTIIIELLKAAPQLAIETAENGQQALDLLAATQTSQYRAILMDLQMPVMDGFTATRQIRAWPDYEDIPIFAMSAHHGGAETQLAREAGIDDFIHKPILESELWDVLQRWHITTLPAGDPHSQAAWSIPDKANEVFDVHVWHELRASIPAARADGLAIQFLAHSEGQMEAVENAMARRDWPTATTILHTIGGTAGSFGLAAAGSCAVALEQRLRRPAEDIEDCGRTLDALLGDLRHTLEQGRQGLQKAVETPLSETTHQVCATNAEGAKNR